MASKHIVRIALCCCLLLACRAWGQTPEGIVHWTLSGPKQIVAGKIAQVDLKANIQSGWHIYAVSQPPGGPFATVITVEGSVFRQDGQMTLPKPESGYDPNFGIETQTHEDLAEYGIPIALAGTSLTGEQMLHVAVNFQTCNESTCLPPHIAHLNLPISIVSMEAAPSKGSLSLAAQTKIVEVRPPAAAKPGNSVSGQAATHLSTEAPAQKPTGSTAAVRVLQMALPTTDNPRSLFSFIWFAMGMGALSLLTPCVFPMIPITVSYFTNQRYVSRGQVLRNAIVYGLGIVLTFTGLGFALALVFGASGVNHLAANPWINLLIAVLFLTFAFTLFGVFFLQIPPAFTAWLDGRTRNHSRSLASLGTLGMGLVFALTSFTCTGPFVGTLLVTASQGNWRWPLVGMLAFSAVFALPFFFLALAPQLLHRLPKPGSWMQSVKVVMGFLELAAAIKFLSNSDLLWHLGLFTRVVVLCCWIVIGFMLALYLLGKIGFEGEAPQATTSFARLMLAMLALAGTVWLATGLGGRSMGELESFLPPEPETAAAQTVVISASKGAWILNDLPAALARARAEEKPVLIDFTGYTCTNCRWMEANMFPRPEVASKLNDFVLTRLFTDAQGQPYEGQQKFEMDRFGTVALPFYVILSPSGKTIATFPGLTRSEAEFLTFLAKKTS